MKKIITLLTVLLVSVMIVACGKTDYSGTYRSVEVTYGGVTVKKGTDAWKTVAGDDDFMVIKLNSDGTGVYELLGEESEEIEYKVDGENLTITEKDKDDKEDKESKNDENIEIKGTIKDEKIDITIKEGDSELKVMFEKETK